MYINNFLCTYNLDKNNDDLTFLIYQSQLLQAFDLREFNESKINKITSDLYDKYSQNERIEQMIKNRKMDLGIDDNLSLFRSCFDFDNFHKIHAILCNIIELERKN